jgi:hypothetical protein
MREGQFRQGRQVRDRRSRQVQAEDAIMAGAQALVCDPERVEPATVRDASASGASVIGVAQEKRWNASGFSIPGVQPSSLATRVSISAHSQFVLIHRLVLLVNQQFCLLNAPPETR